MQQLPELPYKLIRRLSAGAYTEVYEGLAGKEQIIVKIARTQVHEVTGTGPAFASEGLWFATGSLGRWQPAPNEIVQAEAEVLKKLSAPCLPAFVDAGTADAQGDPRAFLVTKRIAGRTWRDIIAAGRKPKLAQLKQLVQHLNLLVDGGLPFHGDIKPENIMSDAAGNVYLIDPSSQLARLDKHGHPERLFLTPQYNPLLAPSDLPALGILLLESQMLQHPLFANDQSKASREIGPQLAFWLKAREATGRSRMTHLLPWIALPSDVDPESDPTLQSIALRCLGLCLDEEGVLELCSPVSTVADLAGELDALDES